MDFMDRIQIQLLKSALPKIVIIFRDQVYEDNVSECYIAMPHHLTSSIVDHQLIERLLPTSSRCMNRHTYSNNLICSTTIRCFTIDLRAVLHSRFLTKTNEYSLTFLKAIIREDNESHISLFTPATLTVTLLCDRTFIKPHTLLFFLD